MIESSRTPGSRPLPAARRRGLPALAALALALAAPQLRAADVEIARSPEFDFSAVASYDWRPHPREEGHPLVEGGTYDVRVRQIVDEHLQRHGVVRLQGETPDLWLVWDGVVHPDYRLEGVHLDLGPVTWIGDPRSEEAYAYENGTLVIAALDPASGETVWSGRATDLVELGNTRKILKKLERAARELMTHFPAR